MGRKSSAKNHTSGPVVPAQSKSGPNPLMLAIVAAAVIGIAVFAFWRGGDSSPAASSTASTTPGAANAPKQAKGDEPTPEIIAATAAQAALGPHVQADLPPIPFRGYAPPRPVEVVTAAFKFAAEHPEVASYIPCFCGCQNGGHKGNTDCFVRSRAQNGDVIEWEEHGLECAVCIDVATRSRQMHASGASVAQIRAAVEKEFGPSFPTMTPTPKPPVAAATHND
jgi:Protein of unknown function with PCYCGC motif